MIWRQTKRTGLLRCGGRRGWCGSPVCPRSAPPCLCCGLSDGGWCFCRALLLFRMTSMLSQRVHAHHLPAGLVGARGEPLNMTNDVYLEPHTMPVSQLADRAPGFRMSD